MTAGGRPSATRTFRFCLMVIASPAAFAAIVELIRHMLLGALRAEPVQYGVARRIENSVAGSTTRNTRLSPAVNASRPLVDRPETALSN
jgi:hypothetical protein